MTKTVYSYDLRGYYVGPEKAYESPLEPDTFLLPARSTEVPPPVLEPGYRARWNGEEWVQEAIPQTTPKPTAEEILNVMLGVTE